MKIENKKVVELTYELTVDGKVVDRTTEMTGPLDYIHGEHMLLPKFEAELEGLEPESEFAFTLTPEEGYGEYDPKHKFEIPKQSFEIDGKIREDLMQVGKIIPMLKFGLHQMPSCRFIQIIYPPAKLLSQMMN